MVLISTIKYLVIHYFGATYGNWQGPHLEHFQVIVAFESRQYHDLNAWIRWSVRGDGIYQSINGATPWKFKYNWDNKLLKIGGSWSLIIG